MKLQKFIKNKKQKRILIGSIVGILFIIGGISLYRSFAMYKVEKTFDVLNGTVPDFSTSDIKLAIMLDGEEVEGIPAKETDKNYKVEVQCDKGAKGSWNYSKWQIEVKNFKKGTKCEVSFTTSTGGEVPPYHFSGNVYFTNDGNFKEIIESLGKQPSDFTKENFNAVILGYNTQGWFSGSGERNILNIYLNYDNINGKVNIDKITNAYHTSGNTCLTATTTLFITGYVFDPSETPFGNETA